MRFLTCSRLYVQYSRLHSYKCLSVCLQLYILFHFILSVTSEEINEVEEFFHNPYMWLSNLCSSHAELPTHLVMFDSLLPVRLCMCACCLHDHGAAFCSSQWSHFWLIIIITRFTLL